MTTAPSRGGLPPSLPKPQGTAAGAALDFELDNIEVEIGERIVLAGVQLRIAPGERVALVGPSGAGKTTLLRLLNGSVQAGRGRVRAGGNDWPALAPRALRALRSKIAFVHQDHALVPNLRVSANVIAGRLGQRAFWQSLRSLIWPARSELSEVYRILERVGIAEKLFERTDRLSGGQRQRVAIARALYQEPRALLADEPLASVDPARSRDLLLLLDGLAQERGFTFVCSLHDLGLAREFFPRLIGLRQGRVVFDRPPAQISEPEIAALYELDENEGGGRPA